jgi:hypothetical protein
MIPQVGTERALRSYGRRGPAIVATVETEGPEFSRLFLKRVSTAQSRTRLEDLFLLQILHHHLHHRVNRFIDLLRIGIEGLAQTRPDEFSIGG